MVLVASIACVSAPSETTEQADPPGGGSAPVGTSTTTSISTTTSVAVPEVLAPLPIGGPELLGAPDGVANRDPFPYCGAVFVVPQQHFQPTIGDDGSVDCFVDRAERNEPTELVMVSHTREGDPLLRVYRVDASGRFQVFTDAVRDSFGAWAWTVETCPSFEALIGGEWIDPLCGERAPLDSPDPARIEAIRVSIDQSELGGGLRLTHVSTGAGPSEYEAVHTIRVNADHDVEARFGDGDVVVGWYEPDRWDEGQESIVLDAFGSYDISLTFRSPVRYAFPPGTYRVDLPVHWRSSADENWQSADIHLTYSVPDVRQVEAMTAFCDDLIPTIEEPSDAREVPAFVLEIEGSATLLRASDAIAMAEVIARLQVGVDGFFDDDPSTPGSFTTGEVVALINGWCSTDLFGFGATSS